jgi:hypothetical protein
MPLAAVASTNWRGTGGDVAPGLADPESGADDPPPQAPAPNATAHAIALNLLPLNPAPPTSAPIGDLVLPTIPRFSEVSWHDLQLTSPLTLVGDYCIDSWRAADLQAAELLQTCSRVRTGISLSANAGRGRVEASDNL